MCLGILDKDSADKQCVRMEAVRRKTVSRSPEERVLGAQTSLLLIASSVNFPSQSKTLTQLCGENTMLVLSAQNGAWTAERRYCDHC